MSNLDSTPSTSITIHPTNPTIIFECSDFRRDTVGLILLLKQKKDPSNKFELHLYNDYTKNQAIAMILDIKDFAKMFESLEEYLLRAQIETYE